MLGLEGQIEFGEDFDRQSRKRGREVRPPREVREASDLTVKLSFESAGKIAWQGDLLKKGPLAEIALSGSNKLFKYNILPFVMM